MTDHVMTKGRAPILDGRLSAALALAENCSVFADIGADHGRLSAVMLLEDEHRYGLVADISAQALAKAKTLIGRMGLAHRVTFAVSDGLDALNALTDRTPDTVFILGMGGDTVSGILLRGAAQLHSAALILGAQTDLPLVRRALCSNGYRICSEVVASESNRDYVLIRAIPAAGEEPSYSEEEFLLGPKLLKTLPKNWLGLLERREQLLSKGIRAMRAAGLEKDKERLALFEREIVYVQRALAKLRKDD